MNLAMKMGTSKLRARIESKLIVNQVAEESQKKEANS